MSIFINKDTKVVVQGITGGAGSFHSGQMRAYGTQLVGGVTPGKGGQMARAAGTYAQIIGKDQGYAQLRLISGELRMVRAECMATIGAVSNPDQQNIKLGKAGRKRWLGKRPSVRGVAMNPIDHPHGGGEGRTSGGRHPVSPWGKPTKGKRTRSNKKTDRLIMRRRRSKK